MLDPAITGAKADGLQHRSVCDNAQTTDSRRSMITVGRDTASIKVLGLPDCLK